MFGRSIVKHNLRYTAYIADGDTKNDISISQSKSYGDLLIERKQCINHFSKRMKTHLSNIKKSMEEHLFMIIRLLVVKEDYVSYFFHNN